MTVAVRNRKLLKGVGLLLVLACMNAADLANLGIAQPVDAFLIRPHTITHHHNPFPTPSLWTTNNDWFGDALQLHNDLLNTLHNSVATQHNHHTRFVNANANAAAPAKTKPTVAATTEAAAEAPAPAEPKRFRTSNPVWERVLDAQLQRWQCASHCNAKQRRTLPYEATFTERVVQPNPILSEYVGSFGGVEIELALPQVKPEDVSVEVDVDTLTIRASRTPRPTSCGDADSQALDTLCECDGDSTAAANSGDDDGAAETTTSTTTVDNGVTITEQTTTSRKRETVSRTYQLGKFVPTEFITASTSTTQQPPLLADERVKCPGTEQFVTTLKVRVPNGVRPGVKKVAITSVESDVTGASKSSGDVNSQKPVPALPTPTSATTTTAATTSTSTSTSTAANPVTGATASVPTTTTTTAAIPSPLPVIGAAPNQPIAKPTVTTDAAGDEVLNL